jgi:uncharacterized protein (TIGR03067 family)
MATRAGRQPAARGMSIMRVFFTCTLGIFLAATVATGGDTKSELAKLQGKWNVELDGKKVDFQFTKDAFTFTIDGKVFKGTFKIDPSKKPKQMDLTIKEGEMYVDKTALATYEVDGEKLKWCANEPGKDGRATEFPEKEGGGGQHLYLVFKKGK